MSKILPIGTVMLILLFSSMILGVATSESNGTGNQRNAVTISTLDVADITNKIIVGFVGSIVGIILTPILREWFKIREAYLMPYVKWCVSFAGILHEFEELCGEFRGDHPKEMARTHSRSSTDVLSHLWSMHSGIEEGYKWLTMVKKDDPRAGQALDEIMDAVDRLWHDLEYIHGELLEKDVTHTDFKKILLRMNTNNPGRIDYIKGYIMDRIQNDKGFSYCLFANIGCFLYQKTPKRLRKLRAPPCSEFFPPGKENL